jgi:hypothetical protein
VVALISTGCSNAPAAAAGTANRAGNTAATASATTDNTAGTAPASTAASSGGNTTANREQAVKFAACMRANGVKQFPDPDASGQLTIDGIANGSSLDTDSAAFKRAMAACKDLEPAGFTGHTRSAQEQAAALKFAQCIRDNGVQDFPDPAPDQPLVDTNRIPSANRSGGMSALNAAMRKCRAAAASAGATGGQ